MNEVIEVCEPFSSTTNNKSMRMKKLKKEISFTCWQYVRQASVVVAAQHDET